MPPKEASSRHPTRDFSPKQILALFLAACALTSIPVLTHRLPPLADYVNHLARMHIINVEGKDAYLDRFYEIHWQIIPNLIMDLVVPPIARVVNIYLAGQFFLISIFVLMLSGTLALNRALFGRWSAVPLVATPLLYNMMLLVGTANYLFGVGLMLWAIAAWIELRERAWPWRYAVSTAFVIALFFCHLVSAALYAVILFAYEAGRVWPARKHLTRSRVFDFCAAGIPFLPVIPLLLMSPTWGLATENSWEPDGKVDGLMYAFRVYYDFIAFILIGAGAIALAWAIRHKLVRFPLMGWILFALGSVIYLAMPNEMFSVLMADQRLPIGFVFMLIACLDVRLPRCAVRHAFVAVVAAAAILRVGEVQLSWDKYSRGVKSMEDSVQLIERGAQVLVAYADPNGGDSVRDLSLMHAACLAIIDRSALVTTEFAVPGKQILRVRADYADHADTEDGTPPTMDKLLANDSHPDFEEAAYWNDLKDNYDYVYVLFTARNAENPDPVNLRLVYEGRHFQLYRTANPHTTTTAAASIERPKKTGH